MTATMIDVSKLVALDRPTAIGLGRTEYQRLVDALRELSPDDWGRPTDCTEWTVRDLAGHVAGMMNSDTAFRRLVGEQIRAGRTAKRDGIDPVDAMTALQVAQMASLSPTNSSSACSNSSNRPPRVADGRRVGSAGPPSSPRWSPKGLMKQVLQSLCSPELQLDNSRQSS